jgi:hypothetical protein
MEISGPVSSLVSKLDVRNSISITLIQPPAAYFANLRLKKGNF